MGIRRNAERAAGEELPLGRVLGGGGLLAAVVAVAITAGIGRGSR